MRRPKVKFLTSVAVLCLVLPACSSGETKVLTTGPDDSVATESVTDTNTDTGVEDGCSWRCEIENLAESDPRAALSKLMELSRENPEVSTECHNTAHDVGRIASINMGAEDAFSLGDLSCGSGYWHGVITQWLADGHEVKELADDCVKQSSNSMARWECGHGIGHAVVLAENLDTALKECGTFPDEIRDGCWHGALMQDYTDDPKRAPYGPCDTRGYDKATADDYLHTCYSMESVRIVKGPGVTPTLEQLRGSIDRCRDIPLPEWFQSCAAGIAGGVTDDSSPDKEELEAACGSKRGDRELENWCWVSAGSNMVANLGGIDEAAKSCRKVATGYKLESCMAGVERSRATLS